MSDSNDKTIDSGEDSGITLVRLVRASIVAQYHGDLRRHVAETERLVAPLIEKLGLKQGVPPRKDETRAGTEGEQASTYPRGPTWAARRARRRWCTRSRMRRGEQVRPIHSYPQPGYDH